MLLITQRTEKRLGYNDNIIKKSNALTSHQNEYDACACALVNTRGLIVSSLLSTFNELNELSHASRWVRA